MTAALCVQDEAHFPATSFKSAVLFKKQQTMNLESAYP